MPDTQPQYYEMAIVFELDISFKTMNKLFDTICQPRVIMQKAIETTVTQTVPFVPTDDNLNTYAQTIADAVNQNSKSAFVVERCRFLRYNYLRPVAPPAEQEEHS